MANLDRPKGFEPHGPVKQVAVMEAGSACYPGDMLTLASDGQCDPASAGGRLVGLCLSYASAAGQKINVSIDPSQLYAVQADETEISSQSLIGNVADIVATAGNSTYKISRQELDSSVAAAGGSQQLVIMGIESQSGNAVGAQVKVLVKINENQLVDAFAGI
jgi:hypothetical protein